jgi:ATP-dependent DNA helicase DinG
MVGVAVRRMAVVRIDIPSKATLPNEWENIQPHFPMPSPRKFQDDALSVVWWALDNDNFDNVVIEAPTGIGKSAIAMTIQSRFQSAYLLSPTLGLTDQYKRDYSSVLTEVRGRANFPCWVKSGTASGAPCYVNGKRCPHAEEKDPCGYYAQKFQARDARLVLTNPAYLFRVIQSPDETFDQRDFAIVDEAHQLEPFFMGLMEVIITLSDFTDVYGARFPFPMHYHADDWKEVISKLFEGAKATLTKAEADRDEEVIESMRAIIGKCSTFLELVENPKDVVIEVNNDFRGKPRLVAKPVRVNKIAPERLDSISRQRIFLSATILDIDTFLNGLGLGDQKTLFVRITQSPFPRQNFNVHIAPCGPMSYSKRKHSIPRQVRAIAGIMDRFPNKRGVILPHTHAIRKELVEGLTAKGFGDRIITHDSNGDGRDVALKQFFESERDDLVLISTYVGEGFDFKGRLAEWLVISKVPFPFTPDPQIAQRMEQDEHEWRRQHEGTPSCPYEPPNKYSGNLCSSFTCIKPCQRWFNLQVALRLIQGAGRINRTPDDVGHLFILDGSFDRYYRQNAHLFPSWFKNAKKDTPSWLKRHMK